MSVRLFSGIVFVLLLSACASSPETRYYYLSVTDRVATPQKIALTGPLGIGPVSVAAYLNRVQITTSDGNHQLDLAMFDHWAEPLNKAVERVLVDYIANRSDQPVYAFPWPKHMPVSYAVTVAIDELDRIGNKAVLKATWMVTDTSKRVLSFQRRSDIVMTISDSSYEDLAAVYSRLIGQLGDQIIYSLPNDLTDSGD